MSDGQPAEKFTWNPTPAELVAYKEREVEMAVDNILYLRSQRITPSSGLTLHSPETFFKALGRLDRR